MIEAERSLIVSDCFNLTATIGLTVLLPEVLQVIEAEGSVIVSDYSNLIVKVGLTVLKCSR